jgi:ribulose-phosphate 3-epimerase
MSTKSIKIAPSILNADFSRLTEQIKIVEDGGADLLHLDVMDGHFVPNLTFGPPVIRDIKNATKLPLEAHLMVKNPHSCLREYQTAGVGLVTVHAEVGHHLHRTITEIHKLGMKAGIALNPATPACAIEPVLPFVDIVLAMTVNPGFGGQEFIPEVLPKIEQIAKMIKDSRREIFLEVDGGIDESSARRLVRSGADVLVIGSAIYGSDDIAGAMKRFRALADRQDKAH